MSSAVLTGRVLHCHVTLRNAHDASSQVHLRLIAEQLGPHGSAFECLMVLGTGYAAVKRGDMMRKRLRPGVTAEAHGECVTIRQHPRSTEAPLLLQGTHYIRGGEQPAWHEAAPAVGAALRRLGRRVQPFSEGAPA